MKNILSTAFVLVALTSMSQTQLRGPVNTSAFGRHIITNEDWFGVFQDLHLSPVLTNYNLSAVGPVGQFLKISSPTTFVGTLDGGTWTNLTSTNITGTIPTYNFPTNIPIYTNVPFGSIGYYNGSNWVTSTNLIYTNSSLMFLYGNVVVAQVSSNGTISGNGSGITNVSTANVVGVLPTNNVTKNAPLNGSLVHYRNGNSSYTSTTNLTFDGSLLVVTNQGSGTTVSLSTNGNFLASGWVISTGPLTNSSLAYIGTNVAPFSVTLNPLTSGLIYTTPLQRGSVSVSCVYSNGALGWLTNLTTHQVRLIGGANYFATNSTTQTIDTSPGDQVAVTNITGLMLVQSSDYTGK